MKLLFAGKKERGVSCLNALIENGHDIVGVIGPSSDDDIVERAQQLGLQLFQPRNVNDSNFVSTLRTLAPDLIILAGYGQIVGQEFIDLAPKGCINLHAGKLPQYRGSSPLNWALINGEKDITLSIIRVDRGVDTGDVLCERTFPISIDDTIADLHKVANREFPEMLVETIEAVQKGKVITRKQDNLLASYYPLRFPEDGLIFFDIYNAMQVHNRIRALTDPYPGAFTFLNNRKVRLLRSKLAKQRFYGEPGRIYVINKNGLLVCALDQCLWITKAVYESNGQTIFDSVERYNKFATLRSKVAELYLRDNYENK